MENATPPGSSSTGSLASSTIGDSDNPTQDGPSSIAGLNVPGQNDSTISTTSTQSRDARPPLGPRELSTDMMDEIRRMIRQEFLGAYSYKGLSGEPASDDGSVSSIRANVGSTSQEKTPSCPGTVAMIPKIDGDEGSCSSLTLSEPLPTPVTTCTLSPALSLGTLAATKLDTPKPGVRFSVGVPDTSDFLSEAAPAPAKRTPWASYRRLSNSSGEPVPEWGVLFDANGFVTARCAQVFRGLARCLVEDSPPGGAVVVTPEKLGLLYSRFKIEGEVYPFEDIFHLFSRQAGGINTAAGVGNYNRLTTYYNRISDFFADLDCEYYLVPPSMVETSFLLKSLSTISVCSASAASPSSPTFPRSSSFSSLHPDPPPTPSVNQPVRSRIRAARPCIPALTPDGFAQFFTICVLAHPDEEAKRLDKIVSELTLVADIPSHGISMPSNTPTTPLSPSSSTPRLPPSPETGQYSERLPRQFLRSLLPVKADTRSRRLLASAVEDLLCDLRLSDSSFSSPATGAVTIPSASTQGRRWSFANAPTSSNSGSISGWSSRVPHLPPPPVPLPRSVSGSAGGSPSTAKLLPLSSSAGSLVKFRTASPPPGTDRYYPHRHRTRRYEPADAAVQSHKQQQTLESTTRATRFEIGDQEEDFGDSASSDTVTTVVAGAPRVDRRGTSHGREHGRERDRTREKEKERERYRENHKDRDRRDDADHDRERERDRDRRPALASRRHSDRRWGNATVPSTHNTALVAMTTPGGSAGGERSGAIVVQKQDERGPTWSEVIKAQSQQKGKGVTFSDEIDRTHE